MCLNCSQYWYCDDEFGCKCGQPTDSLTAEVCACGCHRFFNDDPAIAVPERHKRYATWLGSRAHQDWAREHFICTRHVFQYLRPTDAEGKFLPGHHYADCAYCGEKPILCPKCKYATLNNVPGKLDECRITKCKETA